MKHSDVNLVVKFTLTTTQVCLVIVTAALCPWPTLTGTGYHDGQRITLVGCLLFASAVTCLRLWRSEQNVLSISVYTLWSVFAFFGFGLLSSVFAFSTRHSLYDWASSGLLVLLAWSLAAELAHNPATLLSRILLCCAMGCGFYAFNAMVAYASMLLLGMQPHPTDLVKGFDNHRFFNHMQTVSLPLLGLFALSVKDNKSARYGYVLSASVLFSAWWMLLFAVGGRGTFIGIAIGLAVALYFLRGRAVPLCRAMLIAAATGLVGYSLLYVQVPKLFGLEPFGLLGIVAERTLASPDSGRWPLWHLAMDMVMAQPWLGAGPLHFAHVGRFLQSAAHPHNWALQIACEWGVPAFLCLVCLVFLGMRRLVAAKHKIQLTDQANFNLLATWLTTGTAILVDGLVSGLMVMPTSQLWIALYVGCALGWTVQFNDLKIGNSQKLNALKRYGLILGIAVLVGLTGNGLWPEILELRLHEKTNEKYQTSSTDGHLSPRIWRHGFF